MIEKFYDIIGSIQDWYEDLLDWIEQVLSLEVDEDDF